MSSDGIRRLAIYAGTTGLSATGSSLNVNITGGSSSGTQYTNGTAVSSGSLVGTEALGYDGSNVRALSTDSTGKLIVNQGTSPWVVAGTASDNTANSTAKLPSIPARANASAPSWTEGNQVPLSVDLSGNLRTLATVTPPSSTTSNSPAQQSVTSTSSQILATNASRKEMTIVNTGTTAIYLGLGQTPTTTAYHVALSACTSANDGTGGTYTSDIWKGAVNAICATSGTVVVTELT
jgi:hypothetical protein